MNKDLKDKDVADKHLIKDCKDCGEKFAVSEKELSWLIQKFGESYAEPVRCKECRQKRKDAKRA